MAPTLQHGSKPVTHRVTLFPEWTLERQGLHSHAGAWERSSGSGFAAGTVPGFHPGYDSGFSMRGSVQWVCANQSAKATGGKGLLSR